MKKAILFAVAAFAVSLAGTTGVVVKTHKPAAAAAASTHEAPDSAGTDSVTPTAHRDSVPADSAHGPDSVAAAAAPTHGTPEVAEPGPAAVRPAATKPPTDPAAKAAAYKQVARVLSAMKPPEAAQVLSLLSDDEVEGILRAVGPRQAADFLTNIPKERAATLSRRLLVPRPEGASR